MSGNPDPATMGEAGGLTSAGEAGSVVPAGEAPALQPGTELEGYRIDRFVASGGMGVVYEATQLSLERRVALKFIARELGADERFRERFRREARAAAAIDHPNILPVYEAGELADGSLFLALRFVDGPDLSSLLRECGPLEVREAVAILSQIGSALDAAHDRGLIHRDVKPANVLIERHERGWHAYLTDFGLAKPNEETSEQTRPGEMLGTIDYMAPEQIDGRPLDRRADVYSFGCLVYRCLTNQPPYERDTPTATLMAHANAPVPVPSRAIAGLPQPLDVVVARAMVKDPELRAASAGKLMHWAAAQLQLQLATPDELAEDEAAIGIASSSRPRVRKLGLGRAVLLNAVIYAPIWVVTYLLGRSL
jgi:serine/threonine protein kinase